MHIPFAWLSSSQQCREWYALMMVINISIKKFVGDDAHHDKEPT